MRLRLRRRRIRPQQLCLNHIKSEGKSLCYLQFVLKNCALLYRWFKAGTGAALKTVPRSQSCIQMMRLRNTYIFLLFKVNLYLLYSVCCTVQYTLAACKQNALHCLRIPPHVLYCFSLNENTASYCIKT
jgi:predicted cation transporter